MRIPGIGRIVYYTLMADDANQINRRRQDALDRAEHIAMDRLGYVAHVGNKVTEGDIFPMIITTVWGTAPESRVNGQVFLDGNDTFWASSVTVGEGPGHFSWVTRA